MLKVRTGDLPSEWAGLTISGKCGRIAQELGIPSGGVLELDIGDLKGVLLSKNIGVRHSVKEYKSLEKDAMLMNAKALFRVLKSARLTSVEGSDKEYVSRVFRYGSECLLNGAKRSVGLVIHENKRDTRLHLYHISVY